MISVFSNGNTDVYHGDRKVTVGWAIFRMSDDQMLASGHSLDDARAIKTAVGHLPQISGRLIGMTIDHPLYYTQGTDWRDTAKVRRAKREHNAKRLEMVRSAVRIEVVDLK